MFDGAFRESAVYAHVLGRVGSCRAVPSRAAPPGCVPCRVPCRVPGRESAVDDGILEVGDVLVFLVAVANDDRRHQVRVHNCNRIARVNDADLPLYTGCVTKCPCSIDGKKYILRYSLYP